jgi:DNA-binding HxlR family transcriptional regulator
MPKKRSYRLLCPIARALDKIGDRWTLLIVRDLHAGPARYSELQESLTGLASNLLSSRLKQLLDDGLIRQRAGAHGAQLYELTPDGEATAPLLFELSTYGTRFAAADDVRPPGNLRLVAVSLKESLRRVSDKRTNTHVELVVDDEPFSIRIQHGHVDVAYAAAPDAPVSIAVGYEAIVAVADGDMGFEEFGAQHVRVLRGTEKKAHGFFGLMARAFAG